MKDFSYELSRLPKKPGVYLMKNKEDEIIYVGKAINLKNRVKSYFSSNTNKSPKVLKMVEKIDHFEYIIVENEVEALVLESNFIKEHRPHYNILLRDDKQYPYIKVTNESFPRVEKVRNVKNDRDYYFGPYPNAFAVNDTIDLLRRMFKIRTCNLNFDKGQRLKRPCLSYYIGICDGPCIGRADEILYMNSVDKIKAFLKGNQKEIIEFLEINMYEESKKMNFEKAAEIRDSIWAIDQLMERQKVSTTGGKNIDIISLFKMRDYATIQIFFMRDGKIVDREHFLLNDSYHDDDREILNSFMKQFYLNISFIPDEILLELELSDQEVIERILSEKKGKKVFFKVPKRGEKLDLVKMAKENAQKMMLEFLRTMDERERNKDLGLKNLEKALKIENISRLEAYDISNISGVDSVGSMVVYENGKKAPKEYRKFKIKTVDGPDDYKSLEEVLTRRFIRFINSKTRTGFGKKPDLLIMDGGKGQVNVARKVLSDLKLDIEIIGLYKDDKHKTKGIIFNDREIVLEKNTAIYRFLYEIQEEVHRFAINYHNSLRKKNMLESELLKIPGIGEIRARNLLKTFKSIKNIRQASVDELKKCEGISLDTALEIANYFGGKEDGEKS